MRTLKTQAQLQPPSRRSHSKSGGCTSERYTSCGCSASFSAKRAREGSAKRRDHLRAGAPLRLYCTSWRCVRTRARARQSPYWVRVLRCRCDACCGAVLVHACACALSPNPAHCASSALATPGDLRRAIWRAPRSTHIVWGWRAVRARAGVWCKCFFQHRSPSLCVYRQSSRGGS
jgi:hypothetical protein